MPAERHYNARSILGLNFLLWFWCFLAFLLCPHLLIGLSGRGGGCLATILAVSVLSNRASVFLLSGSFQRAWHFVGKHFPGQVLQDLLGCGAFGNRGPACQELRSLRPPPPPRAAEQAGPAALVLTWLFNLPAECSFSPVKQSGVSGCCPSLPCPALRMSGLLFQPLKALSPGPRCSFIVAIIEFGPDCLSLPTAVYVY